jgi:hypothetical protein
LVKGDKGDEYIKTESWGRFGRLNLRGRFSIPKLPGRMITAKEKLALKDHLLSL